MMSLNRFSVFFFLIHESKIIDVRGTCMEVNYQKSTINNLNPGVQNYPLFGN